MLNRTARVGEEAVSAIPGGGKEIERDEDGGLLSPSFIPLFQDLLYRVQVDQALARRRLEQSAKIRRHIAGPSTKKREQGWASTARTQDIAAWTSSTLQPPAKTCSTDASRQPRACSRDGVGGQCGSKRRVLESQVKVLEQAVGQLREKLALEMGRRITYESQLPIQEKKTRQLVHRCQALEKALERSDQDLRRRQQKIDQLEGRLRVVRSSKVKLQCEVDRLKGLLASHLTTCEEQERLNNLTQRTFAQTCQEYIMTKLHESRQVAEETLSKVKEERDLLLQFAPSSAFHHQFSGDANEDQDHVPVFSYDGPPPPPPLLTNTGTDTLVLRPQEHRPLALQSTEESRQPRSPSLDNHPQAAASLASSSSSSSSWWSPQGREGTSDHDPKKLKEFSIRHDDDSPSPPCRLYVDDLVHGSHADQEDEDEVVAGGSPHDIHLFDQEERVKKEDLGGN